MRVLAITAVAALALASCAPQAKLEIDPNGPSVTMADFKPLEGDDWTGTLTYLDYGSDKLVTIPTKAAMTVKSETLLKYEISYPKEPWENTKSSFKISHSGRVLDGHVLTSRKLLYDGNLFLETLHDGEDDERPAEIRMTYIVGSTNFTLIKNVRFDDSEDFKNRNVYAFSRPASN